MGKKESKSLKHEIIDLLVESDFKAANIKIAENNLSKIEVSPFIEAAYDKLKKNRNYPGALSLCEAYYLPIDWKMNVVNSQFHYYKDLKEYDKAFNWGVNYGMSKNDLNSVAVKAFDDTLDKKNIQKAIGLISKYNIPIDLIINNARQSFNELFEKGDFIKALYLGESFDISRKRVVIAGLKGYYNLLCENNIKELTELEKKTKILQDEFLSEAKEKDINNFVQKFNDVVINTTLKEYKSEELYSILGALEVFSHYQNNPVLAELFKLTCVAVKKSHNQLIEDGRGPAAFDIAKIFRLLDRTIPEEIRKDIIGVVESSHHALLKENYLTAALFLKNNYELFDKNTLENSKDNLIRVLKEYLSSVLEKGAIEDAKTVFQEYEIPQEVKNEAASRAIRQLLNSGQYEAIFEIMQEKIEITDPEILAEITTKFHHTYEDGHMEIASDLAYYFNLREGRVEKATVNHWRRLLDNGKYKEAMALKKQRNISKKLLSPVIMEKYDSLMHGEHIADAIKLRKDYKVKLSIMQWILENFKRMLGR